MLCFWSGWNQCVFLEQMEFIKENGISGECWVMQLWLKLFDGSLDFQIQVCILNSCVLDVVWCDCENVVYSGDIFILDMDFGYENLFVG